MKTHLTAMRTPVAAAGVILCALGLAAAGGAQAADPITLKLAHVVPPKSSKDLANIRFAELVGKCTNGTVKVEVFPGGQLGKEADLAQAVALGTVDLFWGDAATFSPFVKELNVFNTPFLFKDVKQWKTVVRGPIGDDLVQRLEAKSAVKILGRMQMGDRYILTSKKPVRVPADLAGMKIRVPDVPMYTASFAALGAKATPIAFSEVYVSLQQGVIDGMENPSGLIRGMKFYEVTKYLTHMAWSNSVNFLAVNKTVFNKLNAAQKTCMTQAGAQASEHLDTLIQAEEEDNLKFFKEKGMEIVEVKDPAPWINQVKDFPKQYGSNWGTPDLYTRIQNTK
ncbi:MAG: TRAP transporter substrate-binding protein [Pseudomonadota bacterium]